MKLTLCGPVAELEVQPEGLVSDCRGYFQEQYERNHGIDLNEGLCFLDYHSLDPSYLSMIDLVVNDTVPDLTLFLEFSKPVAPQVFGLPGLLQSGSGHAFLNPSVAVYQDSLLVYNKSVSVRICRVNSATLLISAFISANSSILSNKTTIDS